MFGSISFLAKSVAKFWIANCSSVSPCEASEERKALSEHLPPNLFSVESNQISYGIVKLSMENKSSPGDRHWIFCN